MLKKSGIDQELIRQLALLLTETDLSEIEVEQEGFRVRVARSVSAPAYAPPPVVHVPAAPAAPAPAAPVETKADPASHPGAVPSPMVGTAYRASAPGARPFVEIGDTVTAGQTIMIVEAMKHMNQIAAPRGGKVTQILVEDGKPVEYGEILLIVE